MSVRLRIALSTFAILALAFIFTAITMTNLVGGYLVAGLAAREISVAGNLAVSLAPLVAKGDAQSLFDRLTYEASRNGIALIVADNDCNVQSSSDISQIGKRPATPEIVDIVSGQASSYGLHKGTDILTAPDNAEYVVAVATPIEYDSVKRGALLYVVPADNIIAELAKMQSNMLIIFTGATAIGAMLSLIFAGLITKPLSVLLQGINDMTRGNFGARVKVRGRNEIARLAGAFNMMSERLQGVDETRNRFVSNASHELKTPLSTIKILVESMIYEEEMPKELRSDFLNDINNEIDRLSAMTNDLLTLVKTDSGEEKLRRESVKLSETIHEAAKRLAPLMLKKGQELVLTLSDDIIVFADKAKIGQMIYNLIDNAVKYSPSKGKIEITEKRDNDTAIITIKDYGVGIPESELPRVFDRFYRVDKARSRATGGTGLGLSIVKQIVTTHGGEVMVTSEEGKGSTFTVRLPIEL